MKTAQIVMVDDDQDLRDEIVFYFARDGFRICGVPDSASLYRYLMQVKVDIVILDVKLIGEDGFTVASHLRTIPQTRNIGIIMLTGGDEARLRIDGLNHGADVYLVKPIDVRELSAYIGSLHRRLHLTPAVDSIKGWRFLRNKGKLISPSGIEIDLTHLETAFIAMIAHNAGHPVKRKDIISIGFGQQVLAYDNRRLDAIVSRLRRKIIMKYPRSQPIKVAHSVGFIFVDPIECD
jgi:DNA-binding response OmpR family regulator